MKKILLFTLLLMSFSGCDLINEDQQIKKSEIEQGDVISKLIKLPEEVININWEIKPHYRDSSLTVLIEVPEKVYLDITSGSALGDPIDIREINRNIYLKWLEGKLDESMLIKDDVIGLKNAIEIDHSLFVDENGISPYIHGSAVAFGGRFVALMLYTM